MRSIYKAITNSVLYIKLTNWEYWPAWLVHFPTAFMWLWFAARSRSLFFFTTVNPVIETGGVMGESKINILNQFPESVLPKTIFVEREKSNFSEILNRIKLKKINYPLIAKPNIGERGFMVSKIENETALNSYYEKIVCDFLIQELITYPLEVSVLYYRLPGTSKGRITSICIKETLSVIGDRESTVEQLMSDFPRAKLQLPRFRTEFPEVLKLVPKTNEVVELEPIGNHSRGTKFLNGNQHIDKTLEAVFDKISLEIEDIFYGRFDMKCTSVEQLRKGEEFSILEFNGVASEPAHIYDPDYSIFKAYLDLWNHWKVIFEISKIQREKGEIPMSVSEFLAAYKKYRNYLRMVE